MEVVKVSYQESIDPGYLYQETLPGTVKDSLHITFHEIFWGLLIDILLLLTCGVVLVLNLFRRK